MSDVGKMTLENDRNAANIRIYCDDEKRWKARVDPKTGQNTGGWEDPENWVLQPARSIWSRPGCHDTRGGKRFTYAQTYRIYMDGEPSQKQAELRAAITVCPLLNSLASQLMKLMLFRCANWDYSTKTDQQEEC